MTAGYKKGASRNVEMYLRQHPNADLTAEGVAAATGLSREQVISSMSVLRRRMKIVSPGLGIYRWDSSEKVKTDDTPEMMEVLGRTKTGGLLCRGDDSRIYIAQEADI